MDNFLKQKFAAVINRVLANKDVLEKLAPSANEIDGKSDPRSFDALLNSDLGNWVGPVRAANIKAE